MGLESRQSEGWIEWGWSGFSRVLCHKLRFISLKCAAQAVVWEGISEGLRSTSGWWEQLKFSERFLCFQSRIYSAKAGTGEGSSWQACSSSQLPNVTAFCRRLGLGHAVHWGSASQGKNQLVISVPSPPSYLVHSPSPWPCFTHSPGGTIWLFQEEFWSGKHPLSYSAPLPKIIESRYLLTPVTISNKFSITNFYGDAWTKKNTVWLSALELFLQGWLLKTKENIFFRNWAYVTLKVSRR